MASRLNLFGVPPVLVDGENYHRLREPSAQADTRRDRPATGRGPTGQVFGDLPDKWFLSHLAGLIPLPSFRGDAKHRARNPFRNRACRPMDSLMCNCIKARATRAPE
jgi:hypothetical protein